MIPDSAEQCRCADPQTETKYGPAGYKDRVEDVSLSNAWSDTFVWVQNTNALIGEEQTGPKESTQKARRNGIVLMNIQHDAENRKSRCCNCYPQAQPGYRWSEQCSTSAHLRGLRVGRSAPSSCFPKLLPPFNRSPARKSPAKDRRRQSAQSRICHRR